MASQAAIPAQPGRGHRGHRVAPAQRRHVQDQDEGLPAGQAMKLFIDDIRNEPDPSWTLARTINAAVSAIDTFEFETISIVHDISHDGVACRETVTAVALFLKEKYRDTFVRPKIVIHASNPAGAIRIRGILAGFDITVKEAEFGLYPP